VYPSVCLGVQNQSIRHGGQVADRSVSVSERNRDGEWGLNKREQLVSRACDMPQTCAVTHDDSSPEGYTAHMARGLQDNAPSSGRLKTHWDAQGVLFELDVLKCGTLFIRLSTRLDDPRGRLMPETLSIRAHGDGAA
jgi:hypothetical protein